MYLMTLTDKMNPISNPIASKLGGLHRVCYLPLLFVCYMTLLPLYLFSCLIIITDVIAASSAAERFH